MVLNGHLGRVRALQGSTEGPGRVPWRRWLLSWVLKAEHRRRSAGDAPGGGASGKGTDAGRPRALPRLVESLECQVEGLPFSEGSGEPWLGS